MTSQAAPDVWRIEITVPSRAVQAYEEVLEPHVDTVSWFVSSGSADEAEEWHLEAFARSRPDLPAIHAGLALTAAMLGDKAPDVRVSRVPPRDWLAENLSTFPPIRAGRYYVHGTHWREPAPPGAVVMTVDAGSAFGSGEHATTKGCLLALDRLARRRRFRRALDMGCGSGILAIAAAKTWSIPVVAADVDPVAVRVARFNARRNGVADWVRAVSSDGYRHPVVRGGRPYDLILANILARPLVGMAPALARHLAPGGVAVLSGLYTRHERMVLNAHRRHGLVLRQRVLVDDWSTLVLESPSRHA